jgi:hypothetical protein
MHEEHHGILHRPSGDVHYNSTAPGCVLLIRKAREPFTAATTLRRPHLHLRRHLLRGHIPPFLRHQLTPDLPERDLPADKELMSNCIRLGPRV